MPAKKNLSGRTFGLLLVLKEVYPVIRDWKRGKKANRKIGRKGGPLWKCRCHCKRVVTKSTRQLTEVWIPACRECVRIAYRKRPFEHLYNRLLHNKRYPVKLTYDQFVRFTKQSHCFYCRAEVLWATVSGHGASYNLDRKNNALGYSARNCVVCCGRCNHAKGDYFTFKEWVLIGRTIQRLVKKKR
jgi:hypothetical protein